MNGVIVVNKEKDYTSRDVVNKLGGILHTKKLGHTGTLDPMATGVLVICVGTYTKLVDELTSLDKEYIAEITFGAETDTLDTTGNVLFESEILPKKEEILKVLYSFKGKSIQEVPKYSAIKINGKKLYEYAREGIDIELPKREIEVFDINLLSYNDNKLLFKVHVSKGTYIRSLIRDISHKLGTYGSMSILKRTKQGRFNIEDSYTLNDIVNSNYELIKLDKLFDYPVIKLTDEEYSRVKNGNYLLLNNNSNKLILKYNNEDIAIYKKEDNIYICDIMLNNKL